MCDILQDVVKVMLLLYYGVAFIFWCICVYI